MTTSTLETFAQKLMDGPIGEQFKKQEAKDNLAERKQATKAIKDEERALLAALPGLDKEIAAREKEYNEAKVFMENALGKLRQANYERRNFVFSHDQKKHKHEFALRSSYDPAIDKFTRELGELHDVARKLKPDVSVLEQYRDGHCDIETNLKEQQACRAAIGQAIEKVQEMKLQAVDDVPAELDKIRGTVRKVVAGYLDY